MQRSCIDGSPRSGPENRCHTYMGVEGGGDEASLAVPARSRRRTGRAINHWSAAAGTASRRAALAADSWLPSSALWGHPAVG
eukprot:711857-Prymnesium_polylepis.1